jgi:hypothetical protein
MGSKTEVALLSIATCHVHVATAYDNTLTFGLWLT